MSDSENIIERRSEQFGRVIYWTFLNPNQVVLEPKSNQVVLEPKPKQVVLLPKLNQEFF